MSPLRRRSPDPEPIGEFEQRLIDVASEIENAGGDGGMMETALIKGILPQLRKRARKNPDHMRQTIAEVLARVVFILGLTPEEIFPPRREQLAAGDKPN